MYIFIRHPYTYTADDVCSLTIGAIINAVARPRVTMANRRIMPLMVAVVVLVIVLTVSFSYVSHFYYHVQPWLETVEQSVPECAPVARVALSAGDSHAQSLVVAALFLLTCTVVWWILTRTRALPAYTQTGTIGAVIHGAIAMIQFAFLVAFSMNVTAIGEAVQIAEALTDCLPESQPSLRLVGQSGTVAVVALYAAAAIAFTAGLPMVNAALRTVDAATSTKSSVHFQPLHNQDPATTTSLTDTINNTTGKRHHHQQHLTDSDHDSDGDEIVVK